MTTPETFRLLNTGPSSAAMNMAIDEAILLSTSQGDVPPTLRFYAWERPSLSLGYFQRTKRDVNLEAIHARGFDWVRRMTGGRAVLHDRELTYSVHVPGQHRFAQVSVVESYRLLSEGLRAGFEALGLHAQIVSLADEEERKRYASAGSAACFDSPSWYELVVDGRKIAGSAQVRAHGGLLQHGALLLDLSAEDLFSVLQFRSEEERSAVQREFAERAVSVRDLTGRIVSYEEAANAFAHGFEVGLNLSLVKETLTKGEQELAEHLYKEKYSTSVWNERR
ncbi:lipoate--protein ligase family protein [Ferroacidibacillus organovorans]|uniref:Octanoyltransferase n=1 Tax=Ferroacidibacillus organovorans TaxID=1765683 RepID=A0A162T5Q4_9BACL|nr:biotin/lipoate A/B protein ligase family protein [Ferroacidibacillus organovorans]KYP80489.1 octanoyltransferase [Ferroacidibacillus organovorans]OAG94718.1 octanoyltransferase [Ferroacidibacillus organovorans]OPG16569.1 octanoyltransferase [Ferroacidibacillus organovorans]